MCEKLRCCFRYVNSAETAETPVEAPESLFRKTSQTPMYISWTPNAAIERIIERIWFENQQKLKNIKSITWLNRKSEAKQFARTLGAYRDLLYALSNSSSNDRIWPTSKRIDEFWRDQIVNTAQYANDCQAICGRFLHHHDTDIGSGALENSFFYQPNSVDGTEPEEDSPWCWEIAVSEENYIELQLEFHRRKSISSVHADEKNRLKEISALVSSLDLAKTRQAALTKPVKNSSNYLANVEREYRRFLVLVIAYPHRKIQPWNVAINRIWREHITNSTEKYGNDCELIAPGHFIAHNPSQIVELESNGKTIEDVLFRRIQETILTYWTVSKVLKWRGGGFRIRATKSRHILLPPPVISGAGASTLE